MKAITTHYNGYAFRSRLEARWAVFFDALDIEYDYEREGFEWSGVQYLPDFWLDQFNAIVEIKGQTPTEEERNKLEAIARATGRIGAFFWGNIGGETVELYLHDQKDSSAGEQWWTFCWHTDFYGRAKFWYDAELYKNGGVRRLFLHPETYQKITPPSLLDTYFVMGEKKPLGAHHHVIEPAYAAARSARFEHGQKGATP